jgi:thiol-disulfide isomerase/thioredoxin
MIERFGDRDLIQIFASPIERPAARGQDDAKASGEGAMMMHTDSRYIPYAKNVLADTKAQKRVLFFYANWCPTCRPADESFSKNEAKIPQDVRLIRVNYNDTDTDDEEKALAKQYGITYQHTFVQIDAKGAVVTKWNGGQIDELVSHIK